MSAATTQAGPANPAGPASRLSLRRPFGDRAFNVLALGSGLLVLVILVLIALTMTRQSTLWFRSEGWSGVFSTDWDQAHGKFGAMAFVFGTVVTSAIAIIFAVPVSVGVALLLLTEVVPRRWAQPVVYVIDLLSVVPSVVWGLWGILVLAPWLQLRHRPHGVSPGQAEQDHTSGNGWGRSTGRTRSLSYLQSAAMSLLHRPRDMKVTCANSAEQHRRQQPSGHNQVKSPEVCLKAASCPSRLQ